MAENLNLNGNIAKLINFWGQKFETFSNIHNEKSINQGFGKYRNAVCRKRVEKKPGISNSKRNKRWWLKKSVQLQSDDFTVHL